MNIFIKLKNLPQNKYIVFAGLSGILLGPTADAVGEPIFYVALVVFFILFIAFAIYDEINRYNQFNEEVIHIPLIIKVDANSEADFALARVLDTIEKTYRLSNYRENLLKYRGINVENFIFEYNGDLYDFERLLSFAQIISYKVNQTEKDLKTQVRFHVAYYRRPAVGFMLGVIFRTQAVSVYQNNDTGEAFDMVANLVDRSYKERVAEFKQFDVQEYLREQKTKELLIIINSSSHQVNQNAVSLAKFENKITVTLSKNRSTIPPKGTGWQEYSREVYTVIHDAQLHYEKITIAHAMPEALAVLLGMAMENYWNVDITQYQDNEYRYLYNMQDVRFYF